MGKKDAEESSSHKGLTDVIGIILVTVAFVLFSILFLGPVHPTKRGAIVTGLLAGALVVFALVEVAYL